MRALSEVVSRTMLSGEEELDQTVRPIVRGLQGRAGRQRTVLEPSENVSTLARAAPKPRGHGVSASMRWSGPRLGRRVRIYKYSQASSAEEILTCCAALLAVSVGASASSAMGKQPCRPNRAELTDRAFNGVRAFGQQAKDEAATNHVLAAAALGAQPPAGAVHDSTRSSSDDSEDSRVPEWVVCPSWQNHLGGEQNARVKSRPISTWKAIATTRLALTVEALIHDSNHYGKWLSISP